MYSILGKECHGSLILELYGVGGYMCFVKKYV